MERSEICLFKIFNEINVKHFDGFLEHPLLQWNSRLRSSAGRFVSGSRRFGHSIPPKIEIASYLLEEEKAHNHIYDTLAHEMIHYWLWVRHRPYGHTPEFLDKMREMRVQRYNPVPRKRPHKYLYQCLSCEQIYPARKKLRALACLACCKKYSNGKYDVRFKLAILVAQIQQTDASTEQQQQPPQPNPKTPLKAKTELNAQFDEPKAQQENDFWQKLK